MNRDALPAILKACQTRRILVVGDVMLDRFIRGNVSRISPEAPVPVVHVTREDAYPGGAANVARNLAPFAARVHVLGVTGTGPLTDQLHSLLTQHGIDTSGLLASDEHETIVKTRVVARGQQVARIDRETIKAPSPALVARALAWLDLILPQVDAIIIEDYAKASSPRNWSTPSPAAPPPAAFPSPSTPTPAIPCAGTRPPPSSLTAKKLLKPPASPTPATSPSPSSWPSSPA